MILNQKGLGDEQQETGPDRKENREDQGGALEDRPNEAWFSNAPVQGPQGEKRPLLADQLHPCNEKQKRLRPGGLCCGGTKGNRGLQTLQDADGGMDRPRHRVVQTSTKS